MDSYAEAAERLEIARVLVNLGHSYLRTTSVEGSEDEEEEEEKHREEEKSQQGGLEDDLEALNEYQFTENVQHNFEEEMQVKDDDLQVDNEQQFETDNEGTVNVHKNSDFNGENVRKLINIRGLTKFHSEKSNKTDRNEETESDSEMQVNTECNKKLPEHFEDNQQTDENCVKIKLDIEVDADFDQESNENILQEYGNEKQVSDEDIYIKLDIELPDNSDDLESLQLLDTNELQEIYQNCEDDNKMKLEKVKQRFKNKLLQKFDCKKQPGNIELDGSNTIIEDNMLFERQVQKEDISLKHYEEQEIILPTIQRSFNKTICVSPDNIDFHEEIDENVQRIVKEKQIRNIQQTLGSEKLFECTKIVQEQFDKQKQNVVGDEDKKLYDKCNENVLNYFNNESQNIECEFNTEIQVDSEIQLKSRQHNNRHQNTGEDETLEDFDEQMEHTFNSDMQIDDNNLLTAFDDQNDVQELEKITQAQINREPKKVIEKHQNEFSKNIQVQLNKVEQELNNDIQVEFKSEITSLKLELESEKKVKKNIVEKLQDDTKKKIDELKTELFDGKQNVDKSQHSVNKETHENLINQIQHEIEVLQIEAEEFDHDQDEELERIINEKLNKLYSYLEQENFFEDIRLLFDQQSSSVNDRLQTICNQFFQEFNYTSQMCTEKITEEILDAKVIQEAERISKQEVCEKGNKNCISITEHDVDNDIIQVAEKEFDGKHEGESQVYHADKNNEKNKEKTQVEVIEMTEKTVLEDYDVVIMVDSKGSEIQVHINEDMLKKIHDDAQQNVHENQQQSPLIYGQELYGKTFQDIEENTQIEFHEVTQQEVDELNLNENIQIDNNDQQHLNKNIKEKLNQVGIHNGIHLKIDFFTSQNEEGSQDNDVQYKINRESFKNALLKNSSKITQESSDKVDHFETEEQHDGSDLSNEKFKETLTNLNLAFKEYAIKIKKKFAEDVQEESDVDVEGLDENEDQVHKNFTEDIEEVEDESEINIVSNIESDELSEESYVDVEGFEDETPCNLIEKNKTKSEDVEIKHMVHEFKEKQSSSNEGFHLNIGNKSDEKHLLENNEILKFEVLKPCKEINEVVELVEDVEMKCNMPVNNMININNHEYSLVNKYSEEASSSEESSTSEESSLDIHPCVIKHSSSDESSSESSLINKFNSTNLKLSSSERDSSCREELFGSEEEFSSTEEKYSSTDNEEDINGEFEDVTLGAQNVVTEEIDQEVFQDFDEECQSSDSEREVENKKHKFKRRFKLKEKHRQPFENLHMKTDLQNLQNLDEIPLELKIQQEQFEEDLHKQFKGFQKEFYKDLKLEYDQELQLKDKYGSNSESSQVFDEQQETFYRLKDEFHNIEQEYKDCIQQKVFEELQRDIDDKTLFDVENCPEQFGNVINVVDEDIHKEFVELKRACQELEPEFKYNVPLDFEEDNFSQNLKPKPYNLFERLYCKHRQKLCEFADAKTWPENCLYPSSLLDQLFEDPLEFKPNVIVITLFSVDIGYSIKITMKKNDPPVETFFNYADDSILDFVEQEELPPALLEILDKAEPRIFYNGCVIAEIHNKYKGVLNGVYRVLLRPSNLSIQCDVKRIIAENSHINWTYNRRLKLEQKILMACNPTLCLDPSPIAGLAVQLQHQMLSARTFILNPLKYKRVSSKYKSTMKDLSDNLFENTFPSEPLSESSKSMNVASDSEVHHLLWKFDFRLKSVKLIKLYVLRITETQEYSMLMCMISEAESAVKIRFKVNLETNKLKTYINVILDILKEKISSDMLVVRKYKNDSKSSERFLSGVPALFSDYIYDPSRADINQLIDILLEHNSEHTFLKTSLENQKVKSPLTPSQLFNGLQKTDKSFKNSLKIDPQMDQTTTKNIQFCTTKNLFDSPVNFFESPEEQTTIDHQLDHQRKKARLDEVLLKKCTASLSSLKATLPSVIVPSMLNQSENQTHEDSLEESKYVSSPRIDNIKGIKRKRPLS